jgi:hypothetical protein
MALQRNISYVSLIGTRSAAALITRHDSDISSKSDNYIVMILCVEGPRLRKRCAPREGGVAVSSQGT